MAQQEQPKVVVVRTTTDDHDGRCHVIMSRDTFETSDFGTTTSERSSQRSFIRILLPCTFTIIHWLRYRSTASASAVIFTGTSTSTATSFRECLSKLWCTLMF